MNVFYEKQAVHSVVKGFSTFLRSIEKDKVALSIHSVDNYH